MHSSRSSGLFSLALDVTDLHWGGLIRSCIIIGWSWLHKVEIIIQLGVLQLFMRRIYALGIIHKVIQIIVIVSAKIFQI